MDIFDRTIMSRGAIVGAIVAGIWITWSGAMPFNVADQQVAASANATSTQD